MARDDYVEYQSEKNSVNQTRGGSNIGESQDSSPSKILVGGNQCKLCLKNFSDLKEHVSKNHPGASICSRCGSIIYGSDNVQKHNCGKSLSNKLSNDGSNVDVHKEESRAGPENGQISNKLKIKRKTKGNEFDVLFWVNLSFFWICIHTI